MNPFPNFPGLDEVTRKLTQRLTDDGLLIEAGFVTMLAVAYPHTTLPPQQVREMRNVFFAGAQHLFSSILTVLDEDKEPTADDERRMSQIDDELRRFTASLFKQMKPEGNA